MLSRVHYTGLPNIVYRATMLPDIRYQQIRARPPLPNKSTTLLSDNRHRGPITTSRGPITTSRGLITTYRGPTITSPTSASAEVQDLLV